MKELQNFLTTNDDENEVTLDEKEVAEDDVDEDAVTDDVEEANQSLHLELSSGDEDPVEECTLDELAEVLDEEIFDVNDPDWKELEKDCESSTSSDSYLEVVDASNS